MAKRAGDAAQDAGTAKRPRAVRAGWTAALLDHRNSTDDIG